MPELIQNWLGTRLGIILDMNPKNFGRNTKDGTLMAKLLCNFGVIPIHILEKIKESKNFYECYSNWTILKPWLEHIGVTHDNKILERIAGGEGSSAISLFYSVYLNLERHDRLHYISAQRERRFSEIIYGEKFKISSVPESAIRNKKRESCLTLAYPFTEKRELIEWHKEKCKEVVENIKKTKQKFAKMMKKKQPKLGPITSKFTSSQPISQELKEAEETKENITNFEKKHPQKCQNLSYSELLKEQHDLEMQPCFPVPNLTLAQKMLNDLKQKKKSQIYAKNFLHKMQIMVLDEELKEISEKQSQSFEDLTYKNLLKQSQYEKQMANKLYQLREQKKNLAENRRIIESLKMEQKVIEFNNELNSKMDCKEKLRKEEEFKKEKILELHKKLYHDKIKARKEFFKNECQEIVEGITDIVISVSEIRKETKCQVPKLVMKDLKELFFKNLPIFNSSGKEEVINENVGKLSMMKEIEEEEENVTEHETELFYFNQNDKEMENRENYKQSMLDDCDLFDYENLSGPWMVELLFPDGDEKEIEQNVLGYIVHKILEVKYPLPKLPEPAPIKPMKLTCIIQDIEDEAIKMLTEVMALCKILVVCIDNAINFVLSAYKQATSSETIVNHTLKNDRNTLKKKESVTNKVGSKKLLLIKRGNQIREDNEEQQYGEDFYFLDKYTQTPTAIPEEDSLSPNAEIGKRVFESFLMGDPVPDPTIVSAIVAYVTAKQNDYDGWILINYPRLYKQASDLEYALTGYRLMTDLKSKESFAEVEGFTYRPPITSPFDRDDYKSKRTSRLVPNFTKETPLPEAPTTYFNVFLKLHKVSSQSQIQSQELDILSSVEQFYFDRKVFRLFEYGRQNFQTIKNIGKTILGSDTESKETIRKTSLEVFGDDIVGLNEKWNNLKKKTSQRETAIKKSSKAVKHPESEKLETIFTFPFDIEMQLEEDEKSVELKKNLESKKNLVAPEKIKENIKPGDPDWEWVDNIQPKELLLALASLWENMEAVYIEDLKEVFSSIRNHRANVLSYCSFIRKSRKALMKRQDNKQIVLGDFQKKFNAIDEDVRINVDVKTELYVRVAEMEETLMGMADERKLDLFNDIAVVASDNWVPDEMSNLVNWFLIGIQLEANRCITTCQVINDYYLSLSQKVPDEKPIGNIVVPKLQPKNKKYFVVSSFLSLYKNLSEIEEIKGHSKSTLDQESKSLLSEKTNKTRSWTDKSRKGSDANFLDGAAEAIAEILMNLSFPSDRSTPFHDFLKESAASVTNQITNLINNYIEEIQKGEKGVQKNQKKDSDVKTTNTNLNLEWKTALENELVRFLFRVKLILARGIYDMNEFLTTILNTISSITEEVKKMYCKEIQSISDCCKVFRCSIEEEMPIQPQLILKVDEFCVNENILLFEKPLDYSKPTIKAEVETSKFTVDQLSVLFEKLQRVAPDGEIIKRSLLFILEDLRVLNYDMKPYNCFPDSWKSIDPEEMTFILNEIYQDLEIVNWKDFIIYALDLPIPSQQDILTIRNCCKNYDSIPTELISWENFQNVYFWFESFFYLSGDESTSKKVKELLFRMYQIDENQSNYSALLLAFCKDENPINGFMKALALAMGKKIKINQTKSDNSSGAEEFAFEDEGFEEFSKTTGKKLACSISLSGEKALKCIQKEKFLRCDCGNLLKNAKAEEEEDEEEEEISDNAGENESIFYQDSYPYESIPISVVPTKTISTIFTASFPFLPQLSILLDCKETFQETLNNIYDSLESKDGQIDIYKLIRHKFVSRLLLTTNKFKFIKIQKLFECAFNIRNSVSHFPLNSGRLHYNSFA